MTVTALAASFRPQQRSGSFRRHVRAWAVATDWTPSVSSLVFWRVEEEILECPDLKQQLGTFNFVLINEGFRFDYTPAHMRVGNLTNDCLISLAIRSDPIDLPADKRF